MPSQDVRKEFILSSASNYFGIPANEDTIKNLNFCKEVSNFLDDGNVDVLALLQQNKSSIQSYNELKSSGPDEQQLIFFKIKPDTVTADNIHTNVLVSSMFKSPASTLYHAIKKVFGPLLLNTDISSSAIDPKLQNLIADLESGLGSFLRQDGGKGNRDETFSGILTPADEFKYWEELSANGDGKQRERAAYFIEIFDRCKSKSFADRNMLLKYL